MQERELRALLPLIDEAADVAEKTLTGEIASKLRELLQKASTQFPEHSFSVSLTLSVYDEERNRELKLLDQGLAAIDEEEPFRATGDSSFARYLLQGEICELPHDYCPSCWGSWPFKLQLRTCPECGVTLGRDMKLLLDSDVCPHCEEGSVTSSEPRCKKCGFEASEDIVWWG